ncbi:MAG TPA: hypothetical protein VHV74_06345 [Pseudonocardiaceae bacterium]|jgi:hypothetical protein|nr:hypothetical protein [Pseudonocardiaceae bacterium]
MTRPQPVRFLRTEATMAYPEGRLLCVAGTAMYVLAPDGWTKLSGPVPDSAAPLSVRDAEDWCERQGWDLELLSSVPRSAVRPG